MDTSNTIGKFPFALPLLVSGVMHLMKGNRWGWWGCWKTSPFGGGAIYGRILLGRK